MITEIVKASDAEAAAIESEAGYMVRMIEPGPACTLEQAREMAVSAARGSGLRYGVFKVCEVAIPDVRPAEPLPVAKLIARGDELRKRGPVFVEVMT